MPPPPKPAPAPVVLDAHAIEGVDAFVDLAPEMQARIASLGRVETLAQNEELTSFGAALILEGEVAVCAAIVDASVCRAQARTLVPSVATASEPAGLRLVARTPGTSVAIWDQATIEDALRACPWVLDELKVRADRLKALTGATLGPLGDMDEEARATLFERLTVRSAEPNEVVVEAGAKDDKLMLVGAGSVVIEGAEKPLRPGDLIFPEALASRDAAPVRAVAGDAGALLLVGEGVIGREMSPTGSPLVALFAT